MTLMAAEPLSPSGAPAKRIPPGYSAAIRPRELDQLVAVLAEAEGFRAEPYRCSEDVWTIGYGHTSEVTADTASITEMQARLLLDQDCRDAVEAAMHLWDELAALLPWPDLPFARRAALTEMVFQLGPAGCRGFKLMWHALSRGAWRQAAAECPDSGWADQTPFRAARVARLLLAGRFDRFVRP